MKIMAFNTQHCLNYIDQKIDFQIMADACLTHDASAGLGKITAPTLILGGGQDKIVTGRASEELASLIPGCQLYMYEEYGHGLYEEAPDFVKRVTSFLG